MDLVNKYRPTSLNQIIGQDAVVATLRGDLQRDDDLNPTTLFCGPRSTGKTTLAWILALYHNCMNRSPLGDACRECASCKSIIDAVREGRSKTIAVMEKPVTERGIGAIRDLEELARFRCEHRYRFIILDEVHNLTPQAIDGALRLFERPPGQTRFILCTTEPGRLKDTFFSRLVTYRLASIPIEDTAKRLLWSINKRENFGLDQETILSIARSTDGSPREALNLLSQVSAAKQGGMDPSQFQGLVAASEHAKPYIAVKQYCNALLAGQASNMLALAAQFDSYDYLVQQVLVTLNLAIRRIMSDQLVGGDKAWILRDVHVPQPPKDPAQGVALLSDSEPRRRHLSPGPEPDQVARVGPGRHHRSREHGRVAGHEGVACLSSSTNASGSGTGTRTRRATFRSITRASSCSAA